MSGAAIEFIQVSHTMLGHPVPSDLNLEVQRHGLVAALDLFILADDLKYFPPYYAAPVVRSETLTRYPELLPAFLALKQVISEEQMRIMLYQVDGESKLVKQVVADFLATLDS